MPSKKKNSKCSAQAKSTEKKNEVTDAKKNDQSKDDKKKQDGKKDDKKKNAGQKKQ